MTPRHDSVQNLESSYPKGPLGGDKVLQRLDACQLALDELGKRVDAEASLLSRMGRRDEAVQKPYISRVGNKWQLMDMHNRVVKESSSADGRELESAWKRELEKYDRRPLNRDDATTTHNPDYEREVAEVAQARENTADSRQDAGNEAFHEGFKAGKRGDIRCPYNFGTPDYEQWRTGFKEGQREAEKSRSDATARTDPPVSEAQRRFMRYAAEHPGSSGVSSKVSEEFNAADPGGKLPERKDVVKRLEGFPTAELRAHRKELVEELERARDAGHSFRVRNLTADLEDLDKELKSR